MFCIATRCVNAFPVIFLILSECMDSLSQMLVFLISIQRLLYFEELMILTKIPCFKPEIPDFHATLNPEIPHLNLQVPCLYRRSLSQPVFPTQLGRTSAQRSNPYTILKYMINYYLFIWNQYICYFEWKKLLLAGIWDSSDRLPLNSNPAALFYYYLVLACMSAVGIKFL